MENKFSDMLQTRLKEAVAYVLAFGKWLLLAIVVGLLCGVLGSWFHHGVDYATELRGEHPWLIWLLPLGGLLIVALYKLAHTEGQGTNNIFDSIRQGKPVAFLLLPSIFFGTILTHLFGGSAGREGAALQMGGTLGFHAGKLIRLDDADLRTSTMAGMAAFFTALFGTPVAAAIFSIGVISVGNIQHAALIPCLAASLTALGVAEHMGVVPVHFSVQIPELSAHMLIYVTVLAAMCALLSVVFCETIHFTGRQFAKRISNPWIRALAGGAVVAALTALLGTTDYNGAGMDIIAAAVEQGTAHPAAFLLKLVFTAVTLGAGFKGGEVVPSFFVGATFGCVAGPLLGIPSGFAAAVGLISVFCGATNCPLASVFLAVELFGGDGLLYFALACGLSYMLSGYSSLYSSQYILYSKLKASFDTKKTEEAKEAAVK